MACLPEVSDPIKNDDDFGIMYIHIGTYRSLEFGNGNWHDYLMMNR